MRQTLSLFLLVYMLLLLPSKLDAQTPSKLQGWCQTGNATVTVPGGSGPSSNRYQRSYPSCTVTVYDAGTVNLATIYSDSSSTAQANPFTSSSSGIWSFFAMDGNYDVRFSGAGISSPFTMGAFPLWNLQGGKGPWSLARGTLTDSSVSSASLKITVTDNSPPDGPAGLINPVYVPDGFNFTLNSATSGQKVGANGVGVMQQGSLGKSYTTTTQGITANVAAQTVTVADSSVFIDPATHPTESALFCATIDPGVSGSVECVTIISIPSATQVRAVFANNHSNGAVIGQRYSSAQTTLALTNNDVLTTGTGTPGNNDTFGLNIGVQCKNSTFHECVGQETDIINNSGVNGAYTGSGNTPVLYGHSVICAGTNDCSYGVLVNSGSSSTRFLTGLELGGMQDNALTVVNNGAGAVANGINIAAASTYGIVIGSNQTAPSAPALPLSDPTHGIALLATGSGASETSNDLCFQERVASTNALVCLQMDGAGNLLLNRNGSYTFTGWVPASGVSTSRAFVATSAADNTDPKIYVTDQAGSTVTAKMTSLGEVMGTSFASRTQCTSAGGTCGGSPAGHVTIAAAATTVTVATTAVKRNGSSNSTIIVSENSALGAVLGVTCNTTLGRTYAVTAQTDATSFVITASGAPAVNPACLDYWIIN